MQRFIEIAKTGLTSVLQYPVRSVVTICALLAILVPYLTGIGLAAGIEAEGLTSVRVGGDVYVSGNQFGRNTPIPLTLVGQVRAIEGVTEVTPRIIGRVRLGRELVEAVVVGVPASSFPSSVSCIEGHLPRAQSVNEFVVGSALAMRLNLKVGSLIPPFYQNSRGEHVSRIVGIFESDVSLWQSQIMFATFETAEKIFESEGMATDLVVRCRSGYEHNVSSAILRDVEVASSTSESAVPLSVTSRQALTVLLAGAQAHRGGIFNLHFLVAFIVGILTILITSGFGLPTRRREIGILKATGWQTDEILFRSLIESLLLSVGGAALSILIAYVWLKLLNGYWIAAIFIHGADMLPGFSVPFRLTPVPALLAFVIASAITMSGSLWSTWRAAIAPPAEAMR